MAYVQSIVILSPVSDSPIRFTRGILVDDSTALQCLLLLLLLPLPQRPSHPWPNLRSRNTFLIKSTNVNSVLGHSVEANIEADMKDRTPKSDLSNAQSAAVPLSDGTFCYDTTGLYTPKMEEYRWSAKSRDGRAQSQHPRPLRQSHPSTWIRRRWNK